MGEKTVLVTVDRYLHSCFHTAPVNGWNILLYTGPKN